MREEKKQYIKPSIKTELISLEEGIANSSSTLNIGGSSATDAPLVEDWREETSFHDLNF